MNIARYGETAFESVIENHFLNHGYVKITDKFDRTRALFPQQAIAFIQQTQLLVDAAKNEGVGNNYLIEHSAGSGKSNTIGWLTHRLASLYNQQN